MHHRTCTNAAVSLHHELRTTLEEADHYYTLMIEAGEHPNMDRMGYASHIMLDVFRRLLSRPDLQADELAATLREAMIEFEALPSYAAKNDHALRPIRVPRPVQADFNQTYPWQDRMARFVVTRANQN